jgi:hypothetical protein
MLLNFFASKDVSNFKSQMENLASEKRLANEEASRLNFVNCKPIKQHLTSFTKGAHRI